MAGVGDPLETSLDASLSRPGGNVTSKAISSNTCVLFQSPVPPTWAGGIDVYLEPVELQHVALTRKAIDLVVQSIAKHDPSAVAEDCAKRLQWPSSAGLTALRRKY